jgi:hypothetical protein
MGSVCAVGVARPCLPSEPVDELGVRCTVPVATMKPRVRKSVSGGGASLPRRAPRQASANWPWHEPGYKLGQTALVGALC